MNSSHDKQQSDMLADQRISRLRLVWITGILVISVSVLALFQNCSQGVPGDGLTNVEKAAAEMNFAYDTTIDQIAYMSCNMMGTTAFDQSAYFTFRAGAYRFGGIELSNTFLSAYAGKTIDWQSQALSMSAANTNTVLQMALRTNANLQSIETTSGTPVLGQDFSNLFEELGTTDMGTYLLGQTAARVRYMRDGTPSGGRIEGSLYFLNNPTLAQGLRTNLQNNDVFAMTYTDMQNQGTDQTPARGPGSVVQNLPTPVAGATPYPNYLEDTTRYVYGKTFRLTFAAPSQAMTNTNYANNVLLTYVTEMNADNPSDLTSLPTGTNGGWTCPTTLRFKIVRYEDAAMVGCNVGPDAAYQGQTDPLWITRNSLRVEDWYVDMVNQCIVPKKPGYGCYGPQPYVQYDLNSTFWEYFPTQDTAVNPLPVAFASICTRNN